MDFPYDIFSKRVGGYLWIAATSTLKDAQARIRGLAERSPGEYMVFNQRTQEKLIIGPEIGFREANSPAPVLGGSMPTPPNGD